MIAGKIVALERLIATSPALANVPFVKVAGRPVSPSEVLNMLRAGLNVKEILSALASIGMDEPWEEAEEFWRRQAAVSPERPKIYALAQYVPAMTPSQAYEHVRRRDDVGETLVRAYSTLLEFMRLRINL
ncbi:MAG: hypothetical protein AB1589_38455 [Cyanobacteriota bacterium]